MLFLLSLLLLFVGRWKIDKIYPCNWDENCLFISEIYAAMTLYYYFIVLQKCVDALLLN